METKENSSPIETTERYKVEIHKTAQEKRKFVLGKSIADR